MLRASLRSSRAIANGSIVARVGGQWPAAKVVGNSAIRSFAVAQKPSINDSKPVVLPGTAGDASTIPPPPGAVPTSLNAQSNTAPVIPTTNPTIPAANVPLVPPPPPAGKIHGSFQTTLGSPAIATTPPSPPPPQLIVKKPRRVFRRLFTALILLSALGFGGGVYYSRINDNFHDFFTEYVPFGEEAVLYFEEREFRKRFPAKSRQVVRDTGDRVTIPSQSGVSWSIAQDATQAKPKPQEAIEAPAQTKEKDKVAAVKQAKKDVDKAAPAPKPVEIKAEPKPVSNTQPDKKAPTAVPAAATSAKTTAISERMPEVDEPSRFPSEVTRIDPLNIKKADEPIVQDLVKMLNDIILVVNADNANHKFSSTIGKAKSELAQIGDKIQTLKAAAQKEADTKIQASHSDFDRAAKELIKRLEGEMHAQEAQWKDEYENERLKIHNSYEQKLKSELERAKEVNEQRLRNELLEQAIEMKRKFVADVKDRVESERNGRLGKLQDLTSTVNDLEKLTSDWNTVVDTNLKTQHLHVAVEAVRNSLEKAATPKPFIRELAALKEIASDDPVVNAAIASINPVAYQRGVPSSAQLIDRFRRVAGEVRKASLLPEEAGVASHASSFILSKLLFKKKGLAEGDDVESILTRTETLLEEGNLDAAAREMNGLKGWAKTLSKDWLGEVRKVLEVQQALSVIATEARLQSLRVE